MFTSRSHGFIFSSRITSNPNNSWTLYCLFTIAFIWLFNVPSILHSWLKKNWRLSANLEEISNIFQKINVEMTGIRMVNEFLIRNFESERELYIFDKYVNYLFCLLELGYKNWKGFRERIFKNLKQMQYAIYLMIVLTARSLIRAQISSTSISWSLR